MTQATASVLPRESSSPSAFTRDESEALRQLFAEQGFVVVRNVVSPEKLAALGQRVGEEFERQKRMGALMAGGGLLAGHLNCFPGVEARFAYDALVERGVIDLVHAIFPRPLGAPSVGCNFNLPKSVMQHYHADSFFTEDFMIVNVAVVDTDLVNGAIELAPATHKKFYKYWRFAVEMPYRRGVRIPMKRGDVLIRTSNLWHRGMPNRSSVPRPMLAFTFREKSKDSAERDPWALNDGKVMFYENWYRPTRLGRLRERTFVSAPITYAAYRFVRSLFGTKGYGTTP